jgi:sulfur carrier protein
LRCVFFLTASHARWPTARRSPISFAAAVADARYVAVERNGDVVPRDRHSTTPLADGDRIERAVTLVGGG